ncbi:hypothetical protein ACI50J_29800, partial [Escherichia coli]
VDRNPSLSLQTNGTEQFSTKKILNMTSRDQGISSELSNKTIQINEKIHNGIHTEYITDQKNSNNKDREKKIPRWRQNKWTAGPFIRQY